jgi:hypothetical protein
VDEEESQGRQRISIEDRAARRARMESEGRDRYKSLVRALQAGREIPLERKQGYNLDWVPLATRAVVIVLLLGALYVSGLFIYNLWRDAQVDTWQGPDGSVMSGQRLAGCVSVNLQHDDLYPTWVRYRGQVYQISPRQLPVGADATDPDSSYVATGYSLGQMLLLQPRTQTSDYVVIQIPPTPIGRVFLPAPGCV